jgi:hypothetical protein
LKTKRSHIHRGELLKKAVDTSEIRITVLVKRMGISRGTYYNHIESPDLSFELLDQYGKILNHDFRDDLLEMKKFVVEETEPEYSRPKNMKDALEQIDFWRNKYIKLLESIR